MKGVSKVDETRFAFLLRHSAFPKSTAFIVEENLSLKKPELDPLLIRIQIVKLEGESVRIKHTFLAEFGYKSGPFRKRASAK